MNIDQKIGGVLEKLGRQTRKLMPRKRFLDMVEVCGIYDFDRKNLELTAIDDSGPELIFNWSEKHTTPDQLRIEDVFGAFAHSSAKVLHVGVGNSGLAQRWNQRVSSIVGTTISRHEMEAARAANLANYSVHLINKYSPRMLQLPGDYDFIIDNNPNLAPCCKFHFLNLWSNYRELLKPGGMFMTDIAGLGWVLPGSDPGWRLDDRDLDWLADAFGFTLTRAGEGNQVRVLKRTDAG